MAVKAGNEIFSQMKIRREATEISFYKRMLRIPWMKVVSNEEVFKGNGNKKYT